MSALGRKPTRFLTLSSSHLTKTGHRHLSAGGGHGYVVRAKEELVKATTALVRARQPWFATNRRDIARCQLGPQLHDFLSRHAFHVSNEFTLRNGIGVLRSIAYVLPYQQAREECAETPLCLVLQRNVGMLEIFSFDVELLEDFAQPFDRRIALMTTPTTTCNEVHRQSGPCAGDCDRHPAPRRTGPLGLGSSALEKGFFRH